MVLTFFLNLAAALIIALNIKRLRTQIIAAILAGSMIHVIYTFVLHLLFPQNTFFSSSHEIGAFVGGMVANAFLTLFAMWLFRKDE